MSARHDDFRDDWRASKPIADCPQPDGREIKLTDVVHPRLRFLPGMPSNDDHPTPPAMAGRAA